MNTTQKTVPVSNKEIDPAYIAKLEKDYGALAQITQPIRPADPAATTRTGKPLANQYAGYVVDVTDTYITQRVDRGSVKSSLVVHNRADLAAYKSTTESSRKLGELFDAGKVKNYDLTMEYKAEGKGTVYNRDRNIENLKNVAYTLTENSNLKDTPKNPALTNFKDAINASLEVSATKIIERNLDMRDRQLERVARTNQAAMSREAHGMEH